MVSDSVDAEILPELRRNIWADYVFRPLLLAVMVICISISILGLGAVVAPAWQGRYLLFAMILGTVEAIYSHNVLKRKAGRGVSVLRYRLVEWGILLIAVKLLTFTNKSGAELAAYLQTLARQPLAFFNQELLFAMILTLITWSAAASTMNDFEALYDPYTFRRTRVLPIDKLAKRFFFGGGLMVFISGATLWMTREGVESLVDFDRPSLGGIVSNVLVYFMAGLIMLSQVRLTTLQTRWHIQKIEVAEGLGRQWAKYGLAFLALITLAVLFLPTSYSLGFLESTSVVLGFIINIVVTIFQLLILLLTLPLIWLSRLFSGGIEGATPQQFGAFPDQFAQEGQAGPTPEWFEILRSIVFWSIFLLIAGYLVKAYLDDHPELLASIKRFRPLAWLFNLLVTFFIWCIQFIQAGIDLIPKQINVKKPVSQNDSKRARWRWPRLGNLSPKEYIVYYYLNTLKRAEKMGVLRSQDETPYEFEPHLSQAAPDVQAEINMLTESFVHARYSNDTFDREHVAMVKAVWQRIRTALRDTRKEKLSEPSVDSANDSS